MVVVVVIAVARDALFPNFKEAAALNTKLPDPDTLLPAKLIVPFTVIALVDETLIGAVKVTSWPETIVTLLALVGIVVAGNHLVESLTSHVETLEKSLLALDH